ncbi:PilZ domain-containing protein [Tepidiforma flava]|uniref:PilZ domain-containing protein n=1 Tax=Tepidiforma flava TaxID=3004094 RepID=A0ABY7M3U8_9CHLR|nr:PilZ domain-containing protein [Tepidiforma flava]WBL34720.1 PilZ domain-containing protein [Tepidiforma flava]
MERLDGAARRAVARIPASLPYRLLAAGRPVAAGTLLDISVRGAALLADRRPAAAHDLVLELRGPDGSAALAVPAELVTVDPDPFGGWVIRLRFCASPESAACRELARVVAVLRSRFHARQSALARERLGLHPGEAYGRYGPPAG